jgi:hypothetical protein
MRLDSIINPLVQSNPMKVPGRSESADFMFTAVIGLTLLGVVCRFCDGVTTTNDKVGGFWEAQAFGAWC